MTIWVTLKWTKKSAPSKHTIDLQKRSIFPIASTKKFIWVGIFLGGSVRRESWGARNELTRSNQDFRKENESPFPGLICPYRRKCLEIFFMSLLDFLMYIKKFAGLSEFGMAQIPVLPIVRKTFESTFESTKVKNNSSIPPRRRLIVYFNLRR